jgi:hypothetical protein
MTQQMIENGQAGLTVRTAINANFTELYDALAGGGGGVPWDFRPPSAGDFSSTWGVTAPTVSNDANVGMIVDFVSPTAGAIDIRGIAKTIPAPAADWTATTKMHITQAASFSDGNFTGAGMSLYSSLDDKLFLLKVDVGGNLNSLSGQPNGSYGGIGAIVLTGNSLWMRVTYNSGDGSLSADYSMDGKAWVRFLHETTLFAHPFDAVGFGVFYNSTADADQAAKLSVPYWQDSFS